MAAVKLAIIGGGNIGMRHLDLGLADRGCDIVGVVDPSAAAAQRAQDRGVAHFADLDSLLATNRPEGVIVAVPTGLHHAIGLQCASHGLHMLMEKPLTATVAEGRELIAAAEAANVRIATGHHRRFDPSVESARTAIADGRLGRLLAVSAMWFLRKPEPYFDLAWRRRKGAGPILTNLVHDIDILRHVCGEITRVYAETSDSARGFEVEDTAAIILRFASGVLASITLSDAAPSPWGWEQSSGENPAIPKTAIDCYFFAGTKASMSFPSLETWQHANPDVDGWAEPLIHHRPPPHHGARPRQALKDQLQHFCAVVRGTASARVDGHDGLATLAATAAVFAAMERGQPVRPEFTLCD